MKDIYRPEYRPERYCHTGLQPMKIYTRNMSNGEAVGGRSRSYGFFALVAVFILLIACVNFIDLAKARSAMRLECSEGGRRAAVVADRAVYE